MSKRTSKPKGTKMGQARALALAAVAGCTLGLGGLFPVSATAQEQTCANVTEFPCAYQLQPLGLQRAPALFQFQARIAQAKLPLGDATLKAVGVKLVHKGKVLCVEEMKDVVVQGNVLNLTIVVDPIRRTTDGRS